MSLIESVQSVPLIVSEDGTIRVAGSRVALESVVHHFELGSAPEEVARKFPSLRLADIYAVIAYYLNHREEVARYLQTSEATLDHFVTAYFEAFLKDERAKLDYFDLGKGFNRGTAVGLSLEHLSAK